MKVYERVSTYIDENGLKRVAVAEKSGISQTDLNAMLSGRRTLYADELREICLALNVSPELFIDVRGERQSHAAAGG
ncbi:MAG: helix-turn-helix transcriptional regulator [Clostridia bacterium]|nr:helix-turn-helix transcriptional regulator [Clostridia bacterium]